MVGDTVSYQVDVTQEQAGCLARDITITDVIDTEGVKLQKNSIVLIDEDGNKIEPESVEVNGNTFTVNTGRNLINNKSGYTTVDMSKADDEKGDSGYFQNGEYNPLGIDKESKLMRGRNEDGTFQSPFSPLKWGDAFTEGNSWHYTWSVFHDPQGLIDLMGGKEMFITMMDSVFAVPPIFDDSYYGQVIHEIREMTVMNMGNYAHGNQPIQHMIYLYDYAGQPWKAQYWLRQVMDRMYTPGPDGYCGDEDNGQTSAWYVFSALGFYPVCPGTDEYVMGAPLFKKATLHFENGNSLVIDAPNNSTENFYIDSMSFNGADHTKNYLRHEDLFKGGTIKVDMSNRPNLNRGTKEEDMPYSFSKEQ